MTTNLKRLSPAPLKIRTMTITCKTSHLLDYDKVSIKLPLSDKIKNVVYKKDDIIHTRGIKKKQTKRLFYNQMTVEIIVDDKTKKIVNCKIFSNGSIHMTGCRSRMDAINAASIILENVKNINGYIKKKNEVIELRNFQTHLINSNYKIGDNKDIDRYTFYDIFTKKCSFKIQFNPSHYPGVKIHYKYYKDQNAYNWNIIDIEKWLKSIDCLICVPIFFKYNINGKKLIKLSHKKLIKMGIDNTDIRHQIIKAINDKSFIKIVTIIVFRTGQIIITGGQTIPQLNAAYKFINKFIDDNYKQVIVET